MIVKKEKLDSFLDACISSGRHVETGLKLPQKEILEIEDALNKYNDSTAKTKIRKIVKETGGDIKTLEEEFPPKWITDEE